MTVLEIAVDDDEALPEECVVLRDDLGLFLPEERTIGFVPTFEVRADDEGFLVVADLPGVRAEHLKIVMGERSLLVRGRREGARSARGERCYAAERTYGSFERAFELPESMDASSAIATLEAGVLTIRIPIECTGIRRVAPRELLGPGARGVNDITLVERQKRAVGSR